MVWVLQRVVASILGTILGPESLLIVLALTVEADDCEPHV